MTMLELGRRAVLGAAAATMALCQHATAQVITLEAVDSGWYNNTGFHNPVNTTYVVGALGGAQYRNFLVFDLSGITDPIASAQIRLLNAGSPPGFASGDAQETVTLFDVSTPVSTLRAGGGGLAGIFDDLGAGTTLATQTVEAASNGTSVLFDLNDAALSSLSAGGGGLFAVGGAITTLDAAGGDQYAFGFSPGGARQLVLNLTAIPEPSSLLLAGTMVVVVPLVRGRRRAPRR